MVLPCTPVARLYADPGRIHILPRLDRGQKLTSSGVGSSIPGPDGKSAVGLSEVKARQRHCGFSACAPSLFFGYGLFYQNLLNVLPLTVLPLFSSTIET